MVMPCTRYARARRMQSRSASARRKSLRRILQLLRNNLPEFKSRYKIKSLGVFGSYVRDDATEKSDLDVLVEFAETSHIGLFGLVGLQNDLSDLLGIEVDLIQEKTLRSPILENVLKEVVQV